MAEVDAVDGEAVAPFLEVGLARVAARGVVREARGDDHARAGTETHDRRVVADLHARAREKRDAAAQVGGLVPLRPVELGARLAHRVVEEVDARERALADVALPRLVPPLGVREVLARRHGGNRHGDRAFAGPHAQRAGVEEGHGTQIRGLQFVDPQLVALAPAEEGGSGRASRACPDAKWADPRRSAAGGGGRDRRWRAGCGP